MIHILIKDDTVINVDSTAERDRLTQDGWRELTPAEIKAAGMEGYEHHVSPVNTVVGEDGSITFTPPAPPSLDELKATKLQEINAGFEQTASQLVATYPQSELLTFDQQTAEAEAYLADPTAECPMLAPLAAARGITMDDLCQRVMAKHAAFSAATGLLMGQRQAMEDRLELAETVEDVQAIEVAYSLPGAEVA